MPTIVSAARATIVLGPIGAVLAIGTSVLIARWLGPATYADYAMLLAILSWLLLLGESGCNVGLQRYIGEAGAIGARRRLYDVLQLRRWSLVAVLAVVLVVLGPLWAAHAALPSDRWGRLTFAVLGALAGVTLHAQLATSSLFANFHHFRAMTVANLMTILRAATLGAVCFYFSEPLALVMALLAVAVVEATILHVSAVMDLGGERAPLPPGLVTTAQRHGLVGLIDKIATAFTGGSFLLLTLAAFHSRAELAMFAIATDSLQRVLAIVFLPISNLVIPMLNDSRNDRERFVRQMERLGGAVTLMTAFAAAALAAAIPAGLPLLLGRSYAAAVPIALLWIAPLFIEAAIRMVWGQALLAQDQRRWLVGFNIVSGAISLAVIAAVVRMDLILAVAVIGGARIAMVMVILGRAAKLGLLPAAARPLRIVVAAIVALALSWLVQFGLMQTPPLAQLAAGLAVFTVVIGAAVHLLPLIPERSHEVLSQIAGRYAPIFVRLVPRYWTHA